ncbi:MAG: helix-turn-helix transcriptional regulator [Phycisphaerae bacterium]|nr:helix-turn-helix transcriptional regulator [Phycisphaerae bacterium]
MRLCHPHEIDPRVAMANYHAVGPVRQWGGRTIADVELILAVEGRFEYFDDVVGRLIHRPRQVLLIPPRRFHVYRVAGDCEKAFFSCIHHEPLAGRRFADGTYRLDPAPQPLTDVSDDPEVPALFRRAAETFSGYGRFRAELVSTIVKEVYVRLSRQWAEPGGRRLSPRMRRMVAYLREHLAEHPTRRDLAEAFGLTPQYVNALFRQELRTTPTRYVHRECVLWAHRLLRGEGLSVRQAGRRVGFDDPFHFSRVFKRVLGVAPSRL